MMNRTFFSCLILISASFVSSAQTATDYNRRELKELLDQRKLKIDSYSVSLDKHSGIFGNKTKNDIKRSSEVLVDIVKTDNRIISSLYRVVDFRNYEKVNNSFDDQEKNQVVGGLRHAKDTLSKQVDVLKATNNDLQSRLTFSKWLLYILSILSFWLVIRLWRKLKSADNTD